MHVLFYIWFWFCFLKGDKLHEVVWVSWREKDLGGAGREKKYDQIIWYEKLFKSLNF